MKFGLGAEAFRKGIGGENTLGLVGGWGWIREISPGVVGSASDWNVVVGVIFVVNPASPPNPPRSLPSQGQALRG